MKKFATILFIFSAPSLFAQSPAVSVPQKTQKLWIQFDAGLNGFHLYSIPNWDMYDNSISYFEAISIEKELNLTFSVSLGIRNINYGLKNTIQLTDVDGNPTGEKGAIYFNYWTLQTPLQLKIKPFRSKKFALNLGMYFGFNYYNSASTSNISFVVKPDKNKNLMDMGIIVGLDYTWYKKDNFTLGNSVSYYRGINDLSISSFGLFMLKEPGKSQGITVCFTGKWAL